MISEWPLNEADITENVCKNCAMCCQVEIKMNWQDPRKTPWLHVMVEKHDNIEAADSGILIRCSHLEGSDEVGYQCGIYDTRPQLCKDFNCVSWAKVNNDRELYDKVLDRFGITPE